MVEEGRIILVCVRVNGAGCLRLISRSSDTHVCGANDRKNTRRRGRMQATANARINSVVLQIYMKSTSSPAG